MSVDCERPFIPKTRLRESEVEFIECRIDVVKEYFGQICSGLGSYARQTGRVRDAGDSLTNIILQYADQERFNSYLKSNMLRFATALSAVQDFRQARIEKIESKIIPVFSKYEDVCKFAKCDIKNALKSKKRKTKEKQKLIKVKQMTVSSEVVVQGRFTLASEEANKHMNDMKDLMIKFEKNKLTDLKSALLSFVKSEMVFHAKALEIYAESWTTGQNMNISADMEEFVSHMKKQSQAWSVAKKLTAANNDETSSGYRKSMTYTCPKLEELPVYFSNASSETETTVPRPDAPKAAARSSDSAETVDCSFTEPLSVLKGYCIPRPRRQRSAERIQRRKYRGLLPRRYIVPHIDSSLGEMETITADETGLPPDTTTVNTSSTCLPTTVDNSSTCLPSCSDDSLFETLVNTKCKGVVKKK